MLFSNNSGILTRSKHIYIKNCVVVKENIENGEVSMKHIGKNLMILYFLTRGLWPKLFLEHNTLG